MLHAQLLIRAIMASMQEMHSGSGVVTSCISHNSLERYVHVKLALNCNLGNEGEQRKVLSLLEKKIYFVCSNRLDASKEGIWFFMSK